MSSMGAMVGALYFSVLRHNSDVELNSCNVVRVIQKPNSQHIDLNGFLEVMYRIGSTMRSVQVCINRGGAVQAKQDMHSLSLADLRQSSNHWPSYTKPKQSTCMSGIHDHRSNHIGRYIAELFAA